MLYRNTKTGALVDVVSPISGGNWVKVELKESETDKPKETKDTKKETPARKPVKGK